MQVIIDAYISIYIASVFLAHSIRFHSLLFYCSYNFVYDIKNMKSHVMMKSKHEYNTDTKGDSKMNSCTKTKKI
jgi:hypothetical protein